MSTAEHSTCVFTHHQLQNSGTEPHTVLMNELLSIVDYMMLGIATVHSHFVPGSNGNAWVIRGPEMSPVVMIHYQNDSLFVGAEDVTTITDSNNDECIPNCSTWTSVVSASNSIVLNNCETEQRELPSNLKVKSEATCQDILHPISGQQTSTVESIAARGDMPTFGSSDISYLNSLTVYAEQQVQPSFFNATNEHFAVDCEMFEDDAKPCHQILEQKNGPFFEFANRSETYNKLARTIPIGGDAYIVKSEPTDDIISCSDLIFKSDVDCQVTSASWISENKKFCLDQSIADQEICSEKFMDENELERNFTDASIEIVIKGCSVVVEPLDVSTLKNLETICEENTLQQLDAKTSAGTVNTISQNDLQCKMCGKIFQHLVILRFHEKRRGCQQVKQDHEQSSMQQCSSSSKKKGARRQQITQQQRGEMDIKCSHCEATFKCFEYLRKHEKRHEGERRYQCSFCYKKFKNNEQRKRHERTHTGEKPYQCLYCDKKFIQSHHKTLHERTHTNEKPYQCSYCDREFSQSSNRKAHEKTHTGEKPYQCLYCDKKFMWFHRKTLHERTHTNEKPYRCSYCDKRFSQSSNRKAHEKTHRPTGEKPYRCLYCDKEFSHSSSRKTHEKTHR